MRISLDDRSACWRNAKRCDRVHLVNIDDVDECLELHPIDSGAFATRATASRSQPAAGCSATLSSDEPLETTCTGLAAAPEPRIEFKGAVDHHERKRRAEAVAVNDDLVGIGLAREAHQFPSRSGRADPQFPDERDE